MSALEAIYVLTAALLLVFAGLTLADPHHPRRLGTGLFWLLLAAVFGLGSYLPHAVTGCLVLAMVLLDGLGRVKPSRAAPGATQDAPLAAAPSPLGHRVFLPVLAIPAVTIAFALAFRLLGLDVSQGALIGLGLGAVAAAVVALALTRAPLRTLLDDGRRLNDCMGAVNILPQLLASLGVIFAAAGVGDLIAAYVAQLVPRDSRFLLVMANCLGMTLFTLVMGNSFAAFPVIAAGLTVPLLVQPLGIDPALAGIVTLTAGSSGTLITPMAANFNVVPAALLEMRSPYAVLRFQLPYALTIWAAHVLLLWAMIPARP